jgi:outer membrane protein TolC
MRKTILNIFLLSILPMISWSQEKLLTFTEATTLGLENNFNVKIARNDVRMAENNITRGNAGFLPTILFTGNRSFSRQNVNQEFIGGNTNERNGATSNNWNAGVQLNWTVFDGMRMFRTYDKLQAIKDQASITEKVNMENTVLDVALAYYAVVLQKNRVFALDSSLTLSLKRIDISQSRYEVGKTPRNEYLSARVDYNSDYSALVVQQQSLQEAKNNLNNLLARNINTAFEVPTEIPLDTSLNLQSLIELTLSNNTVLQNARMNGEILEYELAEIKSENLPVIDLNANYNYNNSSSEAGFLLSNRTRGLNYGISASWLLYDGSNRSRRQQNNRIQLENNVLLLEQLQLELLRDVENIYLRYRTSLDLIELEEENLQLAYENAEIALDRYQLGKSTFLELREAQLNVIGSLTRLLNAIYSAKVDELNLLRLSGQIIQG